MDWKTKAKGLNQLLTQKEREQAIKKQESENSLKRAEQEYKEVAKIFSPRVKKVCKAFAHGIKGKPWANSSLSSKAYAHYRGGFLFWKNYNEPPEWTPSAFVIFGHKDEYGPRPAITVEIIPNGVLVSTHEYTKSFFLRLSQRAYSEPLPPLTFFRLKECLELTDGNEDWWAACYFIPFDKFTEDELGNALEALCTEIIKGEATIFPVKQ